MVRSVVDRPPRQLLRDFGDHDLRGLDDREHLVPFAEGEALGRGARDDRDQLLVPNLEADLRHHTVGGQRKDAATELISRADVHTSRGLSHRHPAVEPLQEALAREEPPPAVPNRRQLPVPRQRLHALDVEVEEIRGLLGR